MNVRNKVSLASVLLIATTATIAHADTTQTGPDTYEIDAGVDFTLRNNGISSWLVSWTDSSGTFTDVEDPTLILSQDETYTFDVNVGFHIFVITDTTLPVTGTDGDFSRTTFNGTDIDNATLQPIADFTADPEPAIDSIIWTPSAGDLGEYWYTCRITGHAGMTGKIVVVAPPACPADLSGDGMLNFFDVSAFLGAFAAGDPVADFTGDGMFNFFDVSAFLSAFAAGCP